MVERLDCLMPYRAMTRLLSLFPLLLVLGAASSPAAKVKAATSVPRLAGQTFNAAFATFAPADSGLLLVGQRSRVVVVDADRGRELLALSIPASDGYAAGLSAHGKYVYYQGPGALAGGWVTRVWERGEGRLVFDQPFSFAFTAGDERHAESRFFYLAPDEKHAVLIDRGPERGVVARVYLLPSFVLQASIPIAQTIELGQYSHGVNLGFSADGLQFAIADRLFSLGVGPPVAIQQIDFPIAGLGLQYPRVSGTRPWRMLDANTTPTSSAQWQIVDLRGGQIVLDLVRSSSVAMSQDGAQAAWLEQDELVIADLELPRVVAAWRQGAWPEDDRPSYLGGLTRSGIFTLSYAGTVVFWQAVGGQGRLIGTVGSVDWQSTLQKKWNRAVPISALVDVGWHRRPHIFSADGKHLLVGDETRRHWTCYRLSDSTSWPAAAPLPAQQIDIREAGSSAFRR